MRITSWKISLKPLKSDWTNYKIASRDFLKSFKRDNWVKQLCLELKSTTFQSVLGKISYFVTPLIT